MKIKQDFKKLTNHPEHVCVFMVLLFKMLLVLYLNESSSGSRKDAKS